MEVGDKFGFWTFFRIGRMRAEYQRVGFTKDTESMEIVGIKN